MPKKVLLVYGGFSAEREVSISSKDDISAALKSRGYDMVEHDLTDVWKLIDVLRTEKPDVVYNGLYGNWGEDGEIQGLLDMLQIPYTHSSLKASVLGMDKSLTKAIAEKYGVKTARGQVMTYAEYLQKKQNLELPYVVKPVADGSSVGVFLVLKAEDAEKVKYNDKNALLLVEKYIAGRELTVMCLAGKAYVVTELKASNEFYDYNAKYTAGKTQHILPADLPEDVTKNCLQYAEIMHKAVGCNTLSRCDFRYNPKDGVVLLEINTNPGMTSLSLVPEQAKYAGISYDKVCEMLVESATYRPR